MGEEEKKGSLVVAIVGKGQPPISFDGLQDVTLVTESWTETFCTGIDLSASQDYTVINEVPITPNLITAILGLPESVLTDNDENLDAYKAAMWPLFEPHGRLSRKRFKKLLMSHHVERNLAEKAILFYNEYRIPYFLTYKETVAYCWLKGMMDRDPAEC